MAAHCSINVPLNVELYSAEKMTPVEKNILHIDPNTKPVMNGDGICKLRVRISECSMGLGNRKFVLHISAATKLGKQIDRWPPDGWQLRCLWIYCTLMYRL